VKVSRRRHLPGAIACAIATALLCGCHKAGEEAAPAPLSVTAVPAAKGDVAQVVEVSGELSAPPGMDVKLGPLVAGRLGALLVGEGDKVREGQILARLEGTPLRDAVAQAEAQLAQARAQELNAQAKLNRAERAFAAGVAAAQEVEDARLALAQARSAVKSAAALVSTAKNQLGRSELRAPFDGVVAHVFAAAGEPVDANKPVVEVARISPIELRAPLAPRLAALLKAGQDAVLRVEALPGRTFPARVLAVAPTVDATTGAALVRLRADNADGALRLGSFAHAQVQVDVRRGVIRVPVSALLGEEQGAFVEVIADGKAKKLPVKVGARDAQWAEIVEGLSEGAQVIVQGNYALPDGTPVRAEENQGEHAGSETGIPAADASASEEKGK
jgi:membrane fusion protein (multidrug efflux system)